MFARIGSRLCFVAAATLFSTSLLATLGIAGPIPIPVVRCPDSCCLSNNNPCSTMGAGCVADCSANKCAKGGGVKQCAK